MNAPCERCLPEDMQVVVLMGGLGTRLGLADCPKALADVNGIPFFDYQLRLLKRWHFKKFLFLVGRYAQQIEEHYGDGSGWDVEIRYVRDGAQQKGTGGAIKNALPELDEEFLLIYGDSFMDIDYRELVYRFEEGVVQGKHGAMAILENQNRYDKSNVIYENGELLLYEKGQSDERMRYIDYGAMVLDRCVFEDGNRGDAFDLADVLKEMSCRKELLGVPVTRRFYEIGTRESLEEFRSYAVDRFFTSRKAVFFDRDGIINELVLYEESGQLDSPFSREQFAFRDGVVEMLKAVFERGYQIFIVTNQPGAAKGKTSIGALYDLNRWMIGDLKKKGVNVEFVNICPHHPVGARDTKYRFLVRPCQCRKPLAGLIDELCDVYKVDRENSYMIGDSYTDVLAGKLAGLRTIFVGELKCDSCHRLGEEKPDRIVLDLDRVEKEIA